MRVGPGFHGVGVFQVKMMTTFQVRHRDAFHARGASLHAGSW
jgi:hypothetical protein